MNIGTGLTVFAQIVDILHTQGIIDAQGNFIDDLQTEARAIAAIENQLKADGVVVPDKVDQIVQLLPIILALAK